MLLFLSGLPGKAFTYFLHGDAPGPALGAAQRAVLAVFEVRLVVSFFILIYGPVRTGEIADPAFDALLRVPQGHFKAPVLIGQEIFYNGNLLVKAGLEVFIMFNFFHTVPRIETG
jgi:phosphoribosyl-dephospho-CoA transferase